MTLLLLVSYFLRRGFLIKKLIQRSRLMKLLGSSALLCLPSFAQAIAPNPDFSIYIGGAGVDDCDAIATDSGGSIYLGCHSTSTEFAGNTCHPFSAQSEMNAFVIKLSPDSGEFVYVVQLGGAKWEAVQALVVDEAGYTYALGTTYSEDFPATGDVFQATFGGESDAFLTKLDASGVPVWTTFLGGSGDEDGRDIIIGKDGNLHVVGRTDSADFPTTPHALQSQLGGGTDVFYATLSPDGKLLTSTYLGGEGEDVGIAIATDNGGKIYLTGSTGSADFPIKRAVQEHISGGDDLFITVYDPTEARIEFSSYLGGAGRERSAGIGIGSAGEIIVVGQTSSPDLGVSPGTAQSALNGGSDVLVARINPQTQTVLALSYLGGDGSERPRDFLLAGADRALIVGETSSQSLPGSVRTPKSQSGDGDAFLVELNTSTMEVVTSSIQSGSEDDVFEAVTIDQDGAILVTGLTGSEDFVAVGPRPTSFSGGRYDIVVAKFESLSGAGAR